MNDLSNGGAVAKNFLRPRRRKKIRIAAIIFVVVALAYPVARFAIMWGLINVNALLSSFTIHDPRYDVFVFRGLVQYRLLFSMLRSDEAMRRIITNSLLFFPVTCFITLPLSVVFSYFLFKKVPASGVFRVIFFLPSILPIIVLTLSFRFAFDGRGFINPILANLGLIDSNPDYWPLWFGDGRAQMMVFIYCVWAGLGFNIVLLSGAMGRIPQDVIEYGKLEGVGFARELVQIMVPLIWPTITTTFILGMSAVLTIFLQPYFLMGSPSQMPWGTNTISLFIFMNYSSATQAPFLAAFGLLMTVIFVPFVLISRVIMTQLFKDVAY